MESTQTTRFGNRTPFILRTSSRWEIAHKLFPCKEIDFLLLRKSSEGHEEFSLKMASNESSWKFVSRTKTFFLSHFLTFSHLGFLRSASNNAFLQFLHFFPFRKRPLMADGPEKKFPWPKRCYPGRLTWKGPFVKIITVGAENDDEAPPHGAVDRRQCVEANHDEAPHGQGQREPHGHVVNLDAEVGVKPNKGRPTPAELLALTSAFPEVGVNHKGNVLDHDEHVGHGYAWKRDFAV